MKNIPVRQIKATQKEPDLSGSFMIRDVQELLAGNDMVQELHRHDFYYILVLKKGKGNHEIDFTSFNISDNVVFFMRPGQVHQLVLKAGSTGYLVEFKTDFYPLHDKSSIQLLRKAGTLSFYRPDANSLKKILAALTYIFSEYSGRQAGYPEVIKANLDILFIEFVRQNSKSLPATVIQYTQERLEEFLALLETHMSEEKEVSYYAAQLNLSPYQLNAITKTTLGKTSSAIIIEHILLEAKRYLLATSNQVKEIADQLGYEDVSYFIRFFKKHTGHSPDTFRHNFR